MSQAATAPTGPDLSRGIALDGLPENGMRLGHIGGEPALLVRHKGGCFAIGATCTHYGGPLAEGIVVDGAVRCPWSLAPASICAPARPHARLRSRRSPFRRSSARAVRSSRASDCSRPPRCREPRLSAPLGRHRRRGAATQVATETLRRKGHAGRITMFSPDQAPPCDRPNLSKDYLSGTAPEGWIPLRQLEFYKDNDIEFRRGTPVAAIDPDRRQLRCADGTSCDFGALLLATGAEPVHLSLPGSDKARVFCLRSLADSQALIAAAAGAHRTVNVGVSFIRLEVGGVVAFISRIGRLNDPWVDLVNYFRDASVTQIKFRLLADAVTRLA